MQTVLLGGFLGSGKTTILNLLTQYLIDYKKVPPKKVVILENEIGEVSIDDQLIKSNGYKVETMASGCFCCSMSGDLLQNLNRLKKDMDPEVVIIEATGVAYPYKIKESIEQSSLGIKCNTCCIVDANRWNRLLVALKQFITDQLDRTDVVLINKIDLVDSEKLDKIIEQVRSYNPTADLYCLSAVNDVDLSIFDSLFKL